MSSGVVRHEVDGLSGRGMWRSILAVVVVVALAAACTDGGSADDQATAEAGEEVTSEAMAGSEGEALVVTGGGDSGNTSSIAELEARWETARAAVVDRLSGDGIGRDGTALVGTGDFEVDLSRCPDGWTDTVPASEPLTLAALGDSDSYGLIIQGMRAYFERVNALGGINGQQINLVVVDDQRTANKTIEAVGDLELAALPLAVTTFGTTSSQAVFDQLNEACIPQPFTGSAHPAWGDPDEHPWTTGFQMSYATEGVLWGSWMRRNLETDLPLRVGAVTIDSDYGRAHLATFEDWVSRSGGVVSEVVSVTHAVDASDLSDQMAEIAAAEVDVVVLLTAGDGCTDSLVALEGERQRGFTPTVFVASTCADTERFLAPVGSAADGILSVASPMKAPTDAAYADDPFVAYINSLLADAGIDDPTGQAAIGAGQYGWAYVEALRIAGELDGGMSRSNLLLTMRSLRLQHPMLLGGCVIFS